MKKGLLTLLTFVFALNLWSQARVQVIHNSPFEGTMAGPVVDIYVNDALLPELTGVPFRAATPFLDVASGVDLTIDVKVNPSTPSDPPVASFDVGSLANDGTYVIIANGIVGDMDFPFNLEINGAAKEIATSNDVVEFSTFHGSPGAPAVDVDARTVGTVINDLEYGQFEDYIAVAPSMYYLDIRASGTEDIVATYAAPLDLFPGHALTVFASGILGGMPAFGLYAADVNGTVYELNSIEIARFQVIHNSPSPDVDIYFNDALAFENVPFRAATPFDFAPAGVPINVKVVPAGGQIADAVFDNDIMFEENGDTYIVMATGVVGDADAPFTVTAYDAGREAASGDGVDLLLYHGSPDAPEVDVVENSSGGILFDNVAFGEFSDNYVNVPAGSYLLDITLADDNDVVAATYVADVTSLEGGAATVFASGFFSGDDPSFGVWVALADGTTFPLSAWNPAGVQVIHNSPFEGTMAGPVVDIYLNGGLIPELTAVPYRAATSFLEVAGDVDITIDVKLNPSTPADPAVASFDIGALTGGENYVVIANGIVGDPDFPFGLEILAGAKEEADMVDMVEFTTFHGSPGAPAVDVGVRTGGNIITDLVYGEFEPYLAVPSAVYYLDIRATGSTDIVATFEAPLDLFPGKALTVFASGILGGEPAFGLFAVDSDGMVYELSATSIARFQIIHNSPSPDVDIYLNDALTYANVPFRAATAFEFAPAGVPINVKVVPAGGDIMDAVFDSDVTFEENGDTYIIMATGVVGDADAPFTVAAYDAGREASLSGGVDLLLYHGSPDAPEVDVVVSGSGDILFDNVAFGEFSDDYVNVPAGSYELDITLADDNDVVAASYIADVTGLEGGAATVFASGFFSGDDPAFEVWVALADGTTFPLSVVISTADISNVLSGFDVYPNPADDYAFLSLGLEENVELDWQLIDITGRVVMRNRLGQLNAGNQTFEMDFSALQAGTYLLQVITADGYASKKILVK